MSTEAKPSRILSMDQFRGYTVAGMFVVNFLGGMAAIHSIFKHNNSYFSYADSIMPSFMFACGFSYRLSMLRRRERYGLASTWQHAIVRGLALVLVSVMVFGFGEEFKSWSEMSSEGVREFIAKLFKANLWEVLAIIGVTRILLLPVITASCSGPVAGHARPDRGQRHSCRPVQLELRVWLAQHGERLLGGRQEPRLGRRRLARSAGRSRCWPARWPTT